MSSEIVTEKLYYKNINTSEFEAEVLESTKEKKGWKVVLDKTCFFPEGGGQPADKGWINGIPVTDVQKEGDIIYHYLIENPGAGLIKAKIDLQWRRDFMQQHTGQHIISGALWKIGRYKTVSVHMGRDYTTIEIDAPEIPENDLIKVEKLANDVINKDLPVSFIQANKKELDKYHLRKPILHEVEIRLVKIGDFDCVGCGGLHFDSTGNVGSVKATGIEKIRDHARITWMIGDRVFFDYGEKIKIISELKTVFETNEINLPEKARDIRDELIKYKRKCSMLSNQLADMINQNLFENSQVQSDSGFSIITKSWKEEDDNLIKKTMKNLLKRGKVVVCLVNIKAVQINWSIGCSEDIPFPFDEYKDVLLSVIDGKGGGRFPLWQGTGQKPEKTEYFFSKFRDLAKNL